MMDSQPQPTYQLLCVERTNERLLLICKFRDEVTVFSGGLHGHFYGGLTIEHFGTELPGDETGRGMIDFFARDEHGRHYCYSVYSDDIEHARRQLKGVASKDEMLPDLEAFELEPDGSVTLTLSSPCYGTALLSFGDACRYRLTELRVTLPGFGMTEALTFCLESRDGATFTLKARTSGAMDKHIAIMAHQRI